ncbi:MAG: hypothetical protein KBT44_03435 [Bacteroidales bacterium]|nr:hypothetical protein [Candidatus Equibacterium intestinale]
MKRHIGYIFLIALAVAGLSSCDRYYDGYYDDLYYETNTVFLTLRNYSSEATVWFIPDVKCDGELPSELSEWQKIAVYAVEPKSAVQLTFDSSDDYVTPVETYGVNDRMAIYVFKKEVWDSHDWPELVTGKMWCGRCSLSVEEARELHSIVTYPMR